MHCTAVSFGDGVSAVLNFHHAAFDDGQIARFLRGVRCQSHTLHKKEKCECVVYSLPENRISPAQLKSFVRYIGASTYLSSLFGRRYPIVQDSRSRCRVTDGCFSSSAHICPGGLFLPMFWSAETATSGAPTNTTSLICATVQSSEDEIMSEVGQYLAAHLARTERTTVPRCERHFYLFSCVQVVVPIRLLCSSSLSVTICWPMKRN
jgi:hypothetical protein